MTDIVERLTQAIDFFIQPPPPKLPPPNDPIDILLSDARSEIKRLRIGQALIARQIGFYKPETPHFEFVSVPLGILRASLNCVPPPYSWDGPGDYSDHD